MKASSGSAAGGDDLLRDGRAIRAGAEAAREPEARRGAEVADVDRDTAARGVVERQELGDLRTPAARRKNGCHWPVRRRTSIAAR